MNQLLDMHCHLDFAFKSEDVAEKSKDFGISALAATVVPSSFVSDMSKFGAYDNIKLALGIHPWWIAQGRVGEADVARFENLITETPFIGEIGLDFLKQYLPHREKQEEILARILQSVKDNGDGKLLIIHAVHAVSTVLDMLDEYDIYNGNKVMFHWFAGSHEEFGRALSNGCFFSVGMKMMATEKGAEYAKAIPDEALLVESDAPAREGSDWEASLWREELDNTVAGLAEIRGCSADRIADITTSNGLALLRLS